MAKKKTENIKAAPVLRSQPEQPTPTPTPEQTGTRTYQIMDPWKDRDKVNLVDVKSVDGEITEVKVNGEPAGGGGDLRTVQVTFINTGSQPYSLPLPTLTDGHLAATAATQVDIIPNDPHTRPVTVVIGADGCFSVFDEIPTTATATGGVRYDEGNVYITGDGTLTVA